MQAWGQAGESHAERLVLLFVFVLGLGVPAFSSRSVAEPRQDSGLINKETRLCAPNGVVTFTGPETSELVTSAEGRIAGAAPDLSQSIGRIL